MRKKREKFLFDVFLSHSSKDKDIVRDIAERLRADGLKVWFAEWILKPHDNAAAKTDEGLEHSRVLVLCLSKNALGSEWAQLEAGTYRFRDPRDKQRRFIPMRLDDQFAEDSLAQFISINWHDGVRDDEYAKLLKVARKSSRQQTRRIRRSAKHRVINLNYKATVWDYALSKNRELILTGAHDKIMRLWNLVSGKEVRRFKGHDGVVECVAWSPDERFALSSSSDKRIRLWNVTTGKCLRTFKGHRESVDTVVWSNDGSYALSGSEDTTLRLWEIKTGRCLSVLEGHTDNVNRVLLSGDARFALSSSRDQTIRLWNIESGKCLQQLQGHTKSVEGIDWSTDQTRAISASLDGTVRLWDLRLGRCLRVFEGHADAVIDVAWDEDCRYALSGSWDDTLRLWDVKVGQCLSILQSQTSTLHRVIWPTGSLCPISADQYGVVLAWDLSESIGSPQAATDVVFALDSAQIQYTNAKVLLVGDSGVGKSGLSNYLAHDIKVEEEKPLSSTDGAWATHWKLAHTAQKSGTEREVWLWDFAGQVDYRLVHQLFMDDTAAAVLVFNPQNENPFEGLGRWDRDLQKATRRPFAKLLAAGRIDRGGLVVSASSIKKFMMERSFIQPLHLTSAKTGEGCKELRDAIVDSIDWKSIPETTSPALYHRMKQEIIALRDNGIVLLRLAELNQRMEMTLRGENFELSELQAVIGLLTGPGMIQRLDFGGFILLQPEVISRYAAAVVRKVRKHSQELGCISEDDLLAGNLDYQDFNRLPHEDESVVLRALHETFISRAWCLRQSTDGTAILTFPSYFRRERKEQPSHPDVVVTYRFDGPIDDIYATLVVRLHHTVAFESTSFWRAAADFKTQTGAALGFTLKAETEGTSRLEIYFEPDVDENSRVLFLRYVHDHMTQHAQNVVRLRHYTCANRKCDSYNQPFTDQAKIDKALAVAGKGKVFCGDCGKPILLRDAIEQKFESPAVKDQVREMQIEGQIRIDNESRELLAVHHAGFIVAEAGQIYRGYTNSDHGIDGEIEFKDDQGRASGNRLYLQLKSGDSYLKKRARDGAEVFYIKNDRWADYWQQQAYSVMLVIRSSDGEIRWMEITDYLKRESKNKKRVKQIVFDGERFDVMSVRRWRDRALVQAEDKSND
jgi:GTPase SAR1 family protein